MSKRQGYPRSRLPKFTREEVEYVKGTADYFGLNHYTTYLLSWADGSVGQVPSHENDVGIVRVQDPSWPSGASSDWLRVSFFFIQIKLFRFRVEVRSKMFDVGLFRCCEGFEAFFVTYFFFLLSVICALLPFICAVVL